MKSIKTEAILDKKQEDLYKRILGYRYSLLYTLGCKTGLRISDLLHIPTVNLTKTSFLVTEGKTGTKRTVRIGQGLKNDLKRIAGHTYIFESPVLTGKPLSRQAVWKRFKQAAEKAGISDKLIIGTHSMRKNYACNAFLKDLNIGKLRDKMAHKYESTSFDYIQQLFKTIGFLPNQS